MNVNVNVNVERLSVYGSTTSCVFLVQLCFNGIDKLNTFSVYFCSDTHVHCGAVTAAV